MDVSQSQWLRSVDTRNCLGKSTPGLEVAHAIGVVCGRCIVKCFQGKAKFNRVWFV